MEARELSHKTKYLKKISKLSLNKAIIEVIKA